jgi:hypothetical protein
MTAARALNRLAKWRSVFAGWQLGTRPRGDPEAEAVRDHREVTILLRAEVNALAALLIEHGAFSLEDWDKQLALEAAALERAYEKKFPGAHADDDGMHFDMARAQGWMAKFRP